MDDKPFGRRKRQCRAMHRGAVRRVGRSRQAQGDSRRCIDLASHGLLGPAYAIVGFARTPMNDESFRSSVGEAAKSDVGSRADRSRKSGRSLRRICTTTPGEYGNAEDFAKLAKRLTELEGQRRNWRVTGCSILSTPPEVYKDIVEQLGKAGLAKPSSPNSWVRIIIEKPFGRDLASAKELNKIVLSVFEESAGLPHRPLPRQRHGAESVGAAIQQRNFRAAVEPQLRRSRADHRGGDPRSGTARRLLRDRRRAARHDSEPRAAAYLAGRGRAAGVVRCDRGAQRKTESAAIDTPVRSGNGGAVGDARAVCGRQRRRQASSGISLGTGRQPRRRAPKPLSPRRC